MNTETKSIKEAMILFHAWGIDPDRNMVVTLACKLAPRRVVNDETYASTMRELNRAISTFGLELIGGKIQYDVLRLNRHMTVKVPISEVSNA